jgi:hypothetical protein
MSEIQLLNPTLYEHVFSNYLTSVRFGIVHYLVIKINWIGCVSALTTRKDGGYNPPCIITADGGYIPSCIITADGGYIPPCIITADVGTFWFPWCDARYDIYIKMS